MEIVYVHVHVNMDGMMDGCMYVCLSVKVYMCTTAITIVSCMECFHRCDVTGSLLGSPL